MDHWISSKHCLFLFVCRRSFLKIGIQKLPSSQLGKLKYVTLNKLRQVNEKSLIMKQNLIDASVYFIFLGAKH